MVNQDGYRLANGTLKKAYISYGGQIEERIGLPLAAAIVRS